MLSKLYKVLPRPIRKKIFLAVENKVKQNWDKRLDKLEEVLPKIELLPEHVKNLTILTNKTALLDVFPKHSIAAEIGVHRGDYSEKIISVTEPKKLHLIDSWARNQYGDLKKLVMKRFSNETKLGRVFIHQGLSILELEKFDDGYFDWVYIDTNHQYETTAKELEICRFKVMEKGIIAGHDYITGNWRSRTRFGVVEAVNEFCVKHNWEMIYLTHESHRCLSYALRQMF